jgi:hypothetical protein
MSSMIVMALVWAIAGVAILALIFFRRVNARRIVDAT